MRRTSSHVVSSLSSKAPILAALGLLAGCSFDANELKAFPGTDSSATGRPSLDGGGTHDSPTTATGGVDGAATVGTGGAGGTGGFTGGSPDAPLTGAGGSRGTGGIISTV